MVEIFTTTIDRDGRESVHNEMVSQDDFGFSVPAWARDAFRVKVVRGLTVSVGFRLKVVADVAVVADCHFEDLDEVQKWAQQRATGRVLSEIEALK